MKLTDLTVKTTLSDTDKFYVVDASIGSVAVLWSSIKASTALTLNQSTKFTDYAKDELASGDYMYVYEHTDSGWRQGRLDLGEFKNLWAKSTYTGDPADDGIVTTSNLGDDRLTIQIL